MRAFYRKPHSFRVSVLSDYLLSQIPAQVQSCWLSKTRSASTLFSPRFRFRPPHLTGVRTDGIFLVPPPMFNLVRYHGILSSVARWRSSIVPFAPEAADPAHRDGCSAGKQPAHGGEKFLPGCCHLRNYTWAELMKRVWEVDVLECNRCGGRMRILAAINRPEAIKAILECLGLPSRAPPISPALRDKQDFLS
jgi:hypothetical protein